MRQSLSSRAVRQTNWLGTPVRGRGRPSPSGSPLYFARSLALCVGLVYAQLFGYHESRCLPVNDSCVPEFPRLKKLPCELGGFSISACNLRCIWRVFSECCCLNGWRCCITVRSDSTFPQRHSCRYIAILCLPHLLRAHEAVVLPEGAGIAQQNLELKLAPTRHRHVAGRGVSQLSNP